jgi:histidyl-tRNA synthetase
VTSGRLQAPRGTFDVLPEEGARRLALFNLCQALLPHTACFEYVETPVFEDTELFARGVGESTDVVQKEMFTFEDKAGRSLTLRPEGTAGICRAYVEHGMHKLPQPVKLWYWGPYFRHEAPQAGRFRQFAQVGAEMLGTDDPTADAELIAMLAELLESARCRDVRLRLSSLGTAETRRAYSDELRAWLRERESQLPESVRERLDLNPLRAFDADDEQTRAMMAEAPKLLDRLSPGDAEHFTEVRALLDEVGVAYELDPTLVRGLDYYTRTVFEFESGVLGAQAALGGGGRYDGLVELLGGPPTPAVGWAAGIERILMASDLQATEDRGRRPAPQVFVALAKPDTARDAFHLVTELRKAGVAADLERTGRSLKGQLRHADRLGARFTVIMGDQVELKDMQSGDQRTVDGSAEIAAAVQDAS